MRLSTAYALLVSAILGYFLVAIPIQVSDCFGDVVSLQRPMGELVRDTLWQRSFLRPGRYVQAKLVFDLSNGEYHYAFRLVHAAHVVALVLLFVRLLQPRTMAGLVSFPLAMAVLIGGHTFAWTLREAFPINHYLTMVVACAAAANLAAGERRWWNDTAAVLLFVAAALTIESGVLVWVVIAAGYALGFRGVSRRGVAATTACVAAYFVLRFVVLDVGVPTLLDREAGIGLHRYTGAELHAMFGDNVLPFYAYNLAASLAGTLFGEPRDGLFRIAGALAGQPVQPPYVLSAIATTLATAVVGWYAWARRSAWRTWQLDRADRLVALFGIVLAANAAMGYAYTKDVIMAPAGYFFAAAVYVACHHLVATGSARGGTQMATVLLVGALSSLWAVRAVGIHAALVTTALDVREQWTYVDDWLARWKPDGVTGPAAALKEQLQADAIERHPAKPPLREGWTQLFELE